MSTRETQETGGPAFPSVGEGFNNPAYSAPGMTLRDWFAGQALAGLLVENAVCNKECGSRKYIAEDAYLLAGEMLRARATHTDTEG